MLVIALPSPGRNLVMFLMARLWGRGGGFSPSVGLGPLWPSPGPAGMWCWPRDGLQAGGLPALLKVLLQEFPARRRAGNWGSLISGQREAGQSGFSVCCPCVPAVAIGTARVGSSASCSDPHIQGSPNFTITRMLTQCPSLLWVWGRGTPYLILCDTGPCAGSI